MRNIPVSQQIFRHFKGNIYRIVALAEHSESGETLVIYQALYGEFKVYARPLSVFMEKVDRNKYPDAMQEYRFELQNELIGKPISENPEQAEIVAGSAGDSDHADHKNDRKEIQEEPDREVPDLDPLVLEFLDAGTYGERLNILAALHHRITDDMISTMAMAADVEVKEGELEERFMELRSCLVTLDKYECSRMR